MTFLTPWSAIAAAALALPVLLFLYFLKLRRFPLRIPSTLLWRKSIEDMQVNAPFQRLRITLLFLLQLLILALFIAALGQPVIMGESAAGMRMTILIDRSASMNAREPGGATRLDRAKAAAMEVIDRLGSAENPSQAMIIAFAASPQVVSGFDGDKRALREAVESIAPTDEPANLAAALELADAFAGASEEVDSLPVVAVFSDGTVAPPADSSVTDGFAVRAEAVRYVRIGAAEGAASENAGIVAISARRRFDDPDHIDLFLGLINSSPQPLETVITVRVNETPVAVRSISIPAATDIGPGEAPASFDLDLSGGGLITAMLGTPDALATDDIASVVMPAAQAPAILLVAPQAQPDLFVLGLLESAQPRILEVRSDAWYEQRGVSGETDDAAFDLIVFDRVSPPRLPAAPTVFFGALPPGVAAAGESETSTRATRMLSWDRAHPLMQHVELDALIFEGFYAFEIPAETARQVVELAIGPAGPVIGALQGRDASHVFIGFELKRSNWPADVSLLVFLKNVLDQALGLRGSGESISFQTGDVARVRVVPGVERVMLKGPSTVAIEVAGRSHITLPVFRRSGVYAAEGAEEPLNQIAVNVANAVESDIRSREDIFINAQTVTGGDANDTAARELWPWLVAAALVLLIFEWLVYAAKSRG